MDQPEQPPNPATKRIVYAIAGMDKVPVRRDVEYRSTEAGPLTMDIYYPPGLQSGDRAPVVLFVTGYSDEGARKVFGCNLKDMGSYVSWAQLMAASGLVAITYVNQEPSDLHSVIAHIRRNAPMLGIDEDRFGIWACSGNVPNALSLLMQDSRCRVRCAALCYGFTLDVDGFDDVARAARQWGFVNPCSGKSVDDLRRDLPLMIVRAGRDEIPGLNQALDRILVKAFCCNLPMTVVNVSTAPHAFDVIDDRESSREVIKQILAFMRVNLMS